MEKSRPERPEERCGDRTRLGSFDRFDIGIFCIEPATEILVRFNDCGILVNQRRLRIDEQSFPNADIATQTISGNQKEGQQKNTRERHNPEEAPKLIQPDTEGSTHKDHTGEAAEIPRAGR